MNRDLRLFSTETSIGISIAVFVVTLVLAALAWRKSGFARGTAIVETLRVLLVGAVLFTLAQPEWVETELAEERPVVAVLWDASPSMATKDVVSADDPTAPPTSRKDWTAQHVAPEKWSVLGQDIGAEIAIEPFSAPGDVDFTEGEPGTNLSAPLARTLEKFPNLRAVVLVSDGDWNDGEPPLEVATRYRARKVPVFTSVVGSGSALPDLEITSLDPPAFAVSGKMLQMPFSIRSAMPRDVDVTVVLRGDDGSTESKLIRIPAKGTLDDVIDWRAPKPGDVTLTLSLPVQAGEFDETNNEKTASIEIREESLRVLLIESKPRWEYRYFRNALVRDPGVEVSCLLFHPDLRKVGGGPHYIEKFPTKQELAAYDVVFLGDVGVKAGQLGFADCTLLKGLVEKQASGLILMPGFGGHQLSLIDSDLAALFPVNLDPARPKGVGSMKRGRFMLTESGRRSLLMKLASKEDDNATLWEDLPGFQWYSAVTGARPGSQVLAVHRDAETELGRVPLVVTKSFGTGKVLYMGTDAAWRWREGVEDLYHYRFWAQVARWMAYQRRMSGGESMRLFYRPDRPHTGGVVTLNANVMDAGGSPIEDGDVRVRIESPSGQIDDVRMRRDSGEWGLYEGRFEPNEAGMHRLTLTCRETGARLETEIDVIGRRREPLGLPARRDVLDEIARVTRGFAVDGRSFDGIAEHIRRLEERPPAARRVRLWSHPVWGALVVVLMTAFWIGRKVIGRI